MKNKKSSGSKRSGILKKRRWRVAIFTMASVLLSVLISFLNELPPSMVVEYLAGSLLLVCLWQPIFGLPYIGLGAWWILDKRLPLNLLILPFVIALVVFWIKPTHMSQREVRLDLAVALASALVDRDGADAPNTHTTAREKSASLQSEYEIRRAIVEWTRRVREDTGLREIEILDHLTISLDFETNLASAFRQAERQLEERQP